MLPGKDRQASSPLIIPLQDPGRGTSQRRAEEGGLTRTHWVGPTPWQSARRNHLSLLVLSGTGRAAEKGARPGPQAKGRAAPWTPQDSEPECPWRRGPEAGRKQEGRRVNPQHGPWHRAGTQSPLASGPASQGRKLEPWGNRSSGRSTGGSCRPGLHRVYPGISLSGSAGTDNCSEAG